MTDETVSATITIGTSAEAVFAVLADPTQHAAIDGSGWVCESLDGRRITQAGQIFRMAMYHDDHPDGGYEIHNLVLELDSPRSIAWKPGYVSDDTGQLEYGGWVWRYDLMQLGPDRTEVTHTYDWSDVGPAPREYLRFPPFPDDHLASSLTHLAALATR